MAIKRETEESFQRTVVDFAKLHRWLVYHTLTSRGSQPGFPDLVLTRNEVCIVAELKVGRNKTTATQERWLAAFTACGVPAYRWRPADWSEIQRVLGRAS